MTNKRSDIEDFNRFEVANALHLLNRSAGYAQRRGQHAAADQERPPLKCADWAAYATRCYALKREVILASIFRRWAIDGVVETRFCQPCGREKYLLRITFGERGFRIPVDAPGAADIDNEFAKRWKPRLEEAPIEPGKLENAQRLLEEFVAATKLPYQHIELEGIVIQSSNHAANDCNTRIVPSLSPKRAAAMKNRLNALADEIEWAVRFRISLDEFDRLYGKILGMYDKYAFTVSDLEVLKSLTTRIESAEVSNDPRPQAHSESNFQATTTV